MSFRQPKGGRRVIEPKAKNLDNIHVDIFLYAPEILHFALDDNESLLI
jgi:hypothetical protein